jgi:hypothetical protein
VPGGIVVPASLITVPFASRKNTCTTQSPVFSTVKQAGLVPPDRTSLVVVSQGPVKSPGPPIVLPPALKTLVDSGVGVEVGLGLGATCASAEAGSYNRPMRTKANNIPREMNLPLIQITSWKHLYDPADPKSTVANPEENTSL